jgi:hypothetical protein
MPASGFIESEFDCESCAAGAAAECEVAVSDLAARAVIERFEAAPDACRAAALARIVHALRAEHPALTIVARSDSPEHQRALRRAGFRLCPQASGHMAWEHRPYDDVAALQAAWRAPAARVRIARRTVPA